jgi:hypothetical protein
MMRMHSADAEGMQTETDRLARVGGDNRCQGGNDAR